MRIGIVGPPHSGKSVFLNALQKALGTSDPIRAAPDGEGNWTQELYRTNPEKATELRKKGTFSEAFVSWAEKSVTNCDSRFCLIDIGGRVTDENRRICKNAEAIIILSSNLEKVYEWLDFARDLDLKVLAVLDSTLDQTKVEYNNVFNGQFFGLCQGLDRNTFKSSSTIEALASWLFTIIPETVKETRPTMNTITVAKIAENIGKFEEDYQIGNQTRHGLNWRLDDLPKIAAYLKPFSSTGWAFLIDGVMPQWMAVCVVHALHPSVVALADSKVDGGSVQISSRKLPQGSGAGELSWKVSEYADHIMVEYSSDNPIDAAQLNELVPPVTAAGKPVYLSGRTATWAVADIAMTYSHTVPAVYVYQPGVGYVCAITHRPNYKLGEVDNS